MQFAGSHILSISQFERADVERLFTVADAMRPYAHRERITRVLDGAIPVSYTHLTLPTSVIV